MTPARTAHYFVGRVGGRAQKYVVICRGVQLSAQIWRINVASKADARRIAAIHEAVCWNF